MHYTADLDYNDSMYIEQFKDELHLNTLPTDITGFANNVILLDNWLFNFLLRIMATRGQHKDSLRQCSNNTRKHRYNYRRFLRAVAEPLPRPSCRM